MPLEEVVAEVKERLIDQPDYITLSGSGEPTLYVRIGELIDRIRSITKIPIAVLTNGSLLWQPDLRRELAAAHLIVPSLDAGDSSLFQSINRPHPDIGYERMLEGLIAFREEFAGDYWLEVFLLAGHTDMPAEVRKLAQHVKRINPTRVHLNTVSRPPAEEYAASVNQEKLKKFAALFTPEAEVIADSCINHQPPAFKHDYGDVLRLLQRRPCTIHDVSTGLGLHDNEVIKCLEELQTQGLLTWAWVKGECFYRCQPNAVS